MSSLFSCLKGKTVLVTGHTGFKGSWLSEWLLILGARVVGLSLPPSTTPALFDQLGLADRLTHHIADVRNQESLRTLVADVRPDLIFHLAAQPLVRVSYDEPVDTYATNVMGTVHLLDAVRVLGRGCVVICVTTDKCYENKEWLYGYREEDPLGGFDPYSSSKAAAELVIAAYRRSFFNPKSFVSSDSFVALASVRAGNVIGGGDWALGRIIPDCIRALAGGRTIRVRNPDATRPWQHVLESLGGYLTLASRLCSILTPSASPSTGAPAQLPQLCSAFNFGPGSSSNRPVRAVVEEVLKCWPGTWESESDPSAPHEAGLLSLNTDKAFHLLGWQPAWNFADTIEKTVEWYSKSRHLQSSQEYVALARSQICQYAESLP